MNKIITIIVPTYNMEAYLDKCLSSLIVGESDCELMQSLEVLVINDGSADRSSEIAHRYEACYPDTFKVVDKKNGNYGSCINAALPIATGKYIKVLDADDWFDTNAFWDYISFLSRIEVDAIISSFDRVDIEGKITNRCSFPKLPKNSDFPLSKMTVYCDITMHAITYRTDLLRAINYHQTEGISYTDNEWCFLPMAQARHLCYYSGYLYKHFNGREGQTVDRNVRRKNFWMEIQVTQNMLYTYSEYKEGAGLEYLHAKLLSKIKWVYDEVFLYFNSLDNENALRKFDKYMKVHTPSFYEETNQICFSLHHNLHYYYVRLWRRGFPIRIVRMFMSMFFILKHRFGL